MSHNIFRFCTANSLAIIALALMTSLTGGIFTGFELAAQTTPTHRPRTAPKSAPPVAPEVAMPFGVGEKLDYRVTWAAFNKAAIVELSVPERREVFGWRTWHFQAAVHTLRSVRTLFQIDDQFDSYTDTSSLESRQFESYLNELGKTETDVLHLVPTGQSARVPGAAVVVLPGTRDPLGMLFTLRAANWQHMRELRAPVYDGQNLYEMRADIESAAEEINVDAGNFKALRIGIHVFQNKQENQAIHFTIWLANDAARTPILIEADLPFGNLRVELTSARSSTQNGQTAPQKNEKGL